MHPHYGFVCDRHDAAWQSKSRNPQDWDLAVWRPQLGRKKLWRFLTQQFIVVREQRSVMVQVHCSAWTKSLPDTLRIAGSSMTSLWHREAVSKKSVRDITSISCCVTTMKLLHALQIYSTIFIARQHTDARYWYSNSVRPSVCQSVRNVPVLDENGLTFCDSFFQHTVDQSF